MKIIIVRHGDPDYEHHTLTPQGFIEVESLAKRLAKIKIDEVYCSPLPRAKYTCDAYLKLTHREDYHICDWLVEFDANTLTEKGRGYAWDMHPRVYALDPDFYLNDSWYQSSLYIEDGNLKEKYFHVVNEFDQILAKNGYVRQGKIYHCDKGNERTLIFFCHFGVECVLLSHLMNIPATVLWHSTIALPSSLTELISEEREQGFVNFRMQYFGDISHLYQDGLEPSFSGRFTEIFEDKNHRH